MKVQGALLLLVMLGCGTDRQHRFVFDATFTPANDTVVVNGDPTITALHAEFATYAEARAKYKVPVMVSVSSSSRDSYVQPGYCEALAVTLGITPGEMWSETVELVPDAALELAPGNLECVSSTQAFGQNP